MGVKYGKDFRKKISMMYYHIRYLQLYMDSPKKLRRTSEPFWMHLLLKQNVLDAVTFTFFVLLFSYSLSVMLHFATYTYAPLAKGRPSALFKSKAWPFNAITSVF